MNRDLTFDILKGIGIILMVVGHSGAPDWMHDTIYSFHMPLFFIASGWFFSEKCLENKKVYTVKKLKNLYYPYLKWSILFLLLHNVFFYLGVINGSYGYRGAVEKWYHASDMASHFFNIIFRMAGYDALVGTFWFMRALFVGSLVLCFISWLFSIITRQNGQRCVAYTAVVCCLVGGAISYYEVVIPLIPQGGFREMMAVYFMGLGFLMRRNNSWCSMWVLYLSMAIIVFALVLHPVVFRSKVSFIEWMIIIVTGFAGFNITYHLSCQISSKWNKGKKMLVYIGKRTFYIMTFHFLCFKPVSLLKAWLYDMDWQVVGYHPVIPPVDDYYFWIVYAVFALSLSLLLERLINIVPSPLVLLKRR